MIAKAGLAAALGALFTAVVLAWQGSVPPATTAGPVQLRSTAVPMTGAATSPLIPISNPNPFDPCNDIPFDVIERLGLAFTPPEPEEGLRCHFDAGNYQLAVEPIIWRTYAQSLPPDAVETTINGHRAAQYWVMKPTDWNNQWWMSCMVTFKTSYGVIQQSLFFSTIYSEPKVDCPSTNLQRAQELSPYYIF